MFFDLIISTAVDRVLWSDAVRALFVDAGPAA